MKTPQISLVAMESRDKSKVFVRVPDERGRWILAHRCVIDVPCPQCRSAIGEPCKSGSGRYWTDTHFVRRLAGKGRGVLPAGQADQMPAKPRVKLLIGGAS